MSGSQRRLTAAMCALVAASALVGVGAAQTLERARDSLASSEARDRRRGIQELAKLATPEAWRLLLEEGITDREPMVADEAQLAFGAPNADELARLALDRRLLAHKSELVRRRVAEALGRASLTIEANDWRKLIASSEDVARILLLDSLALQAAAGRVPGPRERLVKELVRIATKERQDEPRAHALLALAPLDPDAARALAIEWAADTSRWLRCAAFEAHIALAPDERVTLAGVAVADQDDALRARAIGVLLEARTRPALVTLVERLAVEQRPRLRARIVEGLRAMSGLRHGLEARPWLDWLATLPDDYRAKAPQRADHFEDEARSTSFVGHVVRSDRVAFLIDFSGSMWEEAGERSRKELVDGHLRAALEGLPPSAWFTVLPFTDELQRLVKAPVQASPEAVAEVLEGFERLTTRGKGDIFGAIQGTLGAPNIDTIVLLTDGAPSGGEHWNIELIGDLIARDNRLRQVTIDVVLFGARGPLIRGWRKIAEASGGRLTEVEL